MVFAAMKPNRPDRSTLTRFAWLSIAAAVATISLKLVAYLITGSVGLLSDALESVVNLVGAVMALAMLAVASRKADESHPFGHSKAEYFSSGVEGTLVLVAAIGIVAAAVPRLLSPQPLEQVGIGLAVSVAASLLNLGVALVLRRAGRRAHSVTLEANAAHLLTDVWTSAGVLVGVGGVVLSGWQRLDPLVALLVAGNIVYTGLKIVRKAIDGLMDASLPAEDLAALEAAIAPYLQDRIELHAVRTRQAAARQFVTMHVLVPGDWTVHRGHELLERLEEDVREALPRATVLTHLESLDDPTSWHDIDLDREAE